MGVSVRGYIHVSVGAYGGQRHEILLELGLMVCVSHTTWVLETELKCSVRAIHALSC